MVFNVIRFSQFFSSFISFSTLALTIYKKIYFPINQLKLKFNRGLSGRAAPYSAASQKIKDKIIRGCHKLLEFVKVEI